MQIAVEAVRFFRAHRKPLLATAVAGYGVLCLAVGAVALFTGGLVVFELMTLPGIELATLLGAVGAGAIALAVLGFVVHVLVSAAIAVFVANDGGALRPALGRALRRTGAVLPVGFLAALAIVLLWIATLVGTSLLGALAGSGVATAVIFVLLSLPGLYAALGLAVAVPAAAVEDLGVVAALRTSWQAIRGQRWTALLALGLAYGLVVASLVAAELTTAVLGLEGAFAHLSVLLLAQSAAQAYLAVVVALLYRRLRPDVAGPAAATAPDQPRASGAELGLGVPVRALLEGLGGGGVVLALGFALGALTEHRDWVGLVALLATVVFWVVVVKTGARARGLVPLLLSALVLGAARFALLFASLAWSEYAMNRFVPSSEWLVEAVGRPGSPLYVECGALIPVLAIASFAAHGYRRTRRGDSPASLPAQRA